MLTVAFLSRHIPVRWSTNVLMGAAFTLAQYFTMVNGLAAPVTGWFPIPILMAVVLLPRWDAVFWLVVYCLGLVAAAVLGSPWVEGLEHITPMAFAGERVLTSIAALLITAALEDARRRAVVRAEQRTIETRKLTETLREKNLRLSATVEEAVALHHDLEDLNQRIAEASRQVAQAAEAKSRFLANMSHEIRTPLHALLGLTDLLLDTSLDATQKGYLETMRHSGHGLLGIVNDVLDFAQIESGKLELSLGRVDTRELASGLKSLFAPMADRKNIGFTIEYGDGIPDAVLGDGPRIRQVLSNLLSNAIKFTQAGAVTLALAHKDERLVFEVRDTGPGIPEEGLAKLFRPFSQLNDSTTRKVGGTGLGLAISRDLVSRMGGTLQVRSQLGEGTTFFFDLEAKPAPAAIERFSLAPRQTLGGRVLLAEDDATNRMIAERTLEALGLQVVTACDGREALELAGTQRFDLILLDCHMPVMDGYEAARAIRQLRSVQPPILAWTASVLPEEQRKATSAGMNDVLHKPIDLTELRSKLGQYLSPPIAEGSSNSELQNVAGD